MASCASCAGMPRQPAGSLPLEPLFRSTPLTHWPSRERRAPGETVWPDGLGPGGSTGPPFWRINGWGCSCERESIGAGAPGHRHLQRRVGGQLRRSASSAAAAGDAGRRPLLTPGSIRSLPNTRLGPGLGRAESGCGVRLDPDSAMYPASQGPEAALLIPPAVDPAAAAVPRQRAGLAWLPALEDVCWCRQRLW